MSKIKPVSELRDYNKILREVKPGSPVFLTKNGHGVFVMIDINDYEEFESYQAAKRLKQELDAAAQGEFISNDEIMKKYGL